MKSEIILKAAEIILERKKSQSLYNFEELQLLYQNVLQDFGKYKYEKEGDKKFHIELWEDAVKLERLSSSALSYIVKKGTPHSIELQDELKSMQHFASLLALRLEADYEQLYNLKLPGFSVY